MCGDGPKRWLMRCVRRSARSRCAPFLRQGKRGERRVGPGEGPGLKAIETGRPFGRTEALRLHPQCLRTEPYSWCVRTWTTFSSTKDCRKMRNSF